MEKLHATVTDSSPRLQNGGATDSSTSDGYADDIEAEANSYFHQMFSVHLTIDAMVQMLARFKESPVKRLMPITWYLILFLCCLNSFRFWKCSVFVVLLYCTERCDGIFHPVFNCLYVSLLENHNGNGLKWFNFCSFVVPIHYLPEYLKSTKKEPLA